MSTTTEKLTKHQQRKQELIVASFYNLQQDEAEDVLLLVNSWIEAAFQRGVAAGVLGVQVAMNASGHYHDIESIDYEPDSVHQAQHASITCCDTLSTLYSKEKGFKQ